MVQNSAAASQAASEFVEVAGSSPEALGQWLCNSLSRTCRLLDNLAKQNHEMVGQVLVAGQLTQAVPPERAEAFAVKQCDIAKMYTETYLHHDAAASCQIEEAALHTELHWCRSLIAALELLQAQQGTSQRSSVSQGQCADGAAPLCHGMRKQVPGLPQIGCNVAGGLEAQDGARATVQWRQMVLHILSARDDSQLRAVLGILSQRIRSGAACAEEGVHALEQALCYGGAELHEQRRSRCEFASGLTGRIFAVAELGVAEHTKRELREQVSAALATVWAGPKGPEVTTLKAKLERACTEETAAQHRSLQESQRAAEAYEFAIQRATLALELQSEEQQVTAQTGHIVAYLQEHARNSMVVPDVCEVKHRVVAAEGAASAMRWRLSRWVSETRAHRRASEAHGSALARAHAEEESAAAARRQRLVERMRSVEGVVAAAMADLLDGEHRFARLETECMELRRFALERASRAQGAEERCAAELRAEQRERKQASEFVHALRAAHAEAKHFKEANAAQQAEHQRRTCLLAELRSRPRTAALRDEFRSEEQLCIQASARLHILHLELQESEEAGSGDRTCMSRTSFQPGTQGADMATDNVLSQHQALADKRFRVWRNNAERSAAVKLQRFRRQMDIRYEPELQQLWAEQRRLEATLADRSSQLEHGSSMTPEGLLICSEDNFSASGSAPRRPAHPPEPSAYWTLMERLPKSGCNSPNIDGLESHTTVYAQAAGTSPTLASLSDSESDLGDSTPLSGSASASTASRAGAPNMQDRLANPVMRWSSTSGKSS